MSVRSIALQVLKNVSSGAFLSEELKRYNTDELPLLREITTGTLRNKNYLDYLISKNSSVRFKKIHRDILIILEMSLYQYIFMENIPDYTITNEAVKITKKISHRGNVSFVNGLLRNFMRNKNLEVDLKGDDYFKTYYSVPELYYEYLKENFDEKKRIEIMKLNNSRDNFTIRTNFTKLKRDELIGILKNDFDVKADNLTKSGIIVDNPSGILDTKSFKDGLFYVQDSGSILIGEMLNPIEGKKVLDMCANPGGKTTHIQELMNNTGNVLAFDIKDMRELRENVKRLGLTNIKSEKRDATIFDSKLKDSFDYVLLDAPCSASGLIRRHPEIRYRDVDLEEITKVQKKLLKNALEYVKSGGVILYSTCSIYKCENEDLIREVLKDRDDFEIESINGVKTFRTDPTMSSDGFSMTKIRRK